MLQSRCLGFEALVSELTGDASEPADDDTASAEGLAEWCRPENVGVDVIVVGMTNGVLSALVPTGSSLALSESAMECPPTTRS